MCLPMIPAGPDREVMNPILTVSAGGGSRGDDATVSSATTRHGALYAR